MPDPWARARIGARQVKARPGQAKGKGKGGGGGIWQVGGGIRGLWYN